MNSTDRPSGLTAFTTPARRFVRRAGGWGGMGGLFVILGLAAGCGPPPPPSGPFSLYPRSPALNRVAQTHEEAGAGREEELLLLTTWFHHGDPRAAMMCRVRPDGHVTSFEYIYDAEVRNSRKSDLVADQLAQLRDALRRLPASQVPPVENVLVVSFRRDDRWVTRTYDRTRPPPPAAELFAITEAPLQPQPGATGDGSDSR